MEGASYINLLDVFAPWATADCTKPCPITAVPCALVAQPTGAVELAPISAEFPLSTTNHFVAGIPTPECEVVSGACNFETLYASLGVAIMASVLDGNCAFDVMTMMLGIPPSASARNDLRIEISDYLIARIGEPWMHDILVACQELEYEDVQTYRSGDGQIIAAPPAPAPAVADLAVPAQAVADLAVASPDEETVAAMRWASRLKDDVFVLRLIRSLPKEIVDEQVALYRRRPDAAVAAAAQKEKQRQKLLKIPIFRQITMICSMFLHLLQY